MSKHEPPELSNLTIGTFDSEANGYLETADTVFVSWVINARDKTDRKGFTSTEEYLEHLDSFDVLTGHNIIGYDLPLYFKLFGWKPKAHVIIIDTLWLSRMYWPDLDGGHSLGAWGSRMSNKKLDYIPARDDKGQPCYDPNWKPKDDKGWDTAVYTELMDTYCEQDVDVNVDLLWKLLGLLKNFTWKSIIVEMETAKVIQRQMQHGFVFDYKSAEILHARFMERKAELEDSVHETFRPLPKLVREVQPKVKNNGEVSSVGLKRLGDQWETFVYPPEYTVDEYEIRQYNSGAFSLIDYPEFNLGSRQQIAERLERLGYKIKRKTPKIPAEPAVYRNGELVKKAKPEGGGNPIIDETTLADAVKDGIEEATDLAEYFLITKREGMVKDWLSRAVLCDDGLYRIFGYVNSIGANTNRMTHSSPNVAQTPAGGSPYGEDCRKLYTVRKGYKLVGCDADGLELRCLAHYMGDREYAESVINGEKANGTDVHTLNQLAAGLSTRDQAKTFIYAFLYGAGDAKIGAIVGGNAKDGKKLKERFLEFTPALKALRTRIQSITDNREWIRGVDGRILRVRSQHSALNTLLQGMGAIVMKYWLVEVARLADAQGLDWNPCANVHDEGQFEVLEAHVPAFRKICEEAFITVSKDLDLQCLCTGSSDVGDTWYETH